VKVCPTGIDIRNGTQLECVNCTACIDACDSMMDAVGLPRGLIRYASERSIATKKPARYTPRMKAYTVLMVILIGVEAVLLSTRSDISVTIMRTPGQLFQDQAGGQLSNLYNYKLLNKTYGDREVTLRPENFRGSIRIVGREALTIPKSGYASGALFIYREKSLVTERKTDLRIGVYEGDRKIQTVDATFLGPFSAN
jgi:polyferredoxin